MLEIGAVLAAVSLFNIVMLAGAIVAVVVCLVLLIRRISQRRRERD